VHPIRATLLATLTVLTACAPAGDTALENGQPVGLLEYTATAPADWEPMPTASTMRLAEFAVAASGDEGGGEVVAYFFGPDQGGSVEANTQRWTAQFFDGDGNHPEPAVEVLEDGVFPTTVVTLEGSYARTVGMGGAPAEAVPGQMLVAAVVETPRGSLYIQLHGPAETVRGERDAFLAFVRTVRPQSPGGTSG
jgi:hypothetical protein